MRLKHLSLQGYKSFANRVEFLFPTGVTAIVGPNGSGKSNVADGIRWVLGEQSMRSLRGKSTADMIFAGGRRRAPAGMAEVSMTFDNTDGWLPIAFSEVTISRRAYRSGENEYLINGTRVRLRDITELLAESGLGQRAYTVIGQGLVDTALSLRPQERRALFEEAAGIGLYRERREDALQRLEETQRNLERVHDIISEITPRLARLQQEAEKAEEYRRLTAHLERLQRTWYGYQWGLHQTRLEEAVEKATAFRASLEARLEEAQALSEQLTRLRQREHELRASLRGWLRQSADLHETVGEIRRELAVAEERARLSTVRQEELASELEHIEMQRQAQEERVAQARARMEQLEQTLAEREQRLAEHERIWNAAKEQAQAISQHRAEIERDLANHRARLEERSRDLADIQTEAARLEGERAALSRLRESLTLFDAGVQALLQEKPEGVIGPLASLIQTPAEWEAAIEAALGPDLQALVIERASLVENLQRRLTEAGGRATLLPLDELRPIPPLPAGVLCAADVVLCDERVRPAVETTLGAAALCRDLAEARALLPALPYGSRCVTADGIVLRADGALSIGAPESRGLLASERAWRELPAKLESMARQQQEIEQALQKEREQIVAVQAELERLMEEESQAQKEAARIEREQVHPVRTEAAVARETLRSQQAVLESETALLDRLWVQATARRQKIAELESECAATLAHAQRLRDQASQMDAQLRQMRLQVQPAEEELNRLNEKQAALELEEQQARDRAREAEARANHAQLEVERQQDELNLLSQRIAEELGLVELELTENVKAQTPLPLRPVVSALPLVEELPEGIEEEIQRLKARLRRLGGVNPDAAEEYEQVRERHQFLTEQSADLEKAASHLRQVIAELDALMRTSFLTTFEAAAARFSETFTLLFNGGDARLELTEPDDLLNTGVDIIAQPPGKRAQRLALLSGGERSLTAVALLFALLQVSPAPFCVLDEVDAMLDEANVGRFRGLLQKMARQTQFIVITHNRGTIEAADTIYGISMGADGISQVVSLKLEQ